MRSSGGFLLLLIGALGLIGFLSGNLDRWLAYLFSPTQPPPPGSTTGSLSAAVTAPPSSDRRSA